MSPTSTPRKSLSPDLAIVVFAKAPVMGRCKTRLARHVGHARATRCYRAMTEQVATQLATLSDGPLILCCAPDTTHPFLSRLAKRLDCRRTRQRRGHLGQRLQHAVSEALTTASRVVVVGTDQPLIPATTLAEIDRFLGRSVDACMAPTRDGGYWLLGLARSQPSVFRGIDWSTPRVARQTRTAFRRAGLAWYEPAPSQDIDNYRDWCALPRAERARLSQAAVMPGGPTGQLPTRRRLVSIGQSTSASVRKP